MHIDIYSFFSKDKVESKKMSIVYCSIEHMLADFFTKALQGAIFAKFCDMVMGRKHVDTFQMWPPSTKGCVGNVLKFRSNQEEIESNMDTGGERIESNVEIEGDRIGYSMETKKKWNEKEMHKPYADIVCI